MNASIREKLIANIFDGLKKLYDLEELGITESLIQLQIPKNTDFGDVSTNIAFKLANKLKTRPDVLAKQLAETMCALKLDNSVYEKVEVAGNAFLNFFLKHNVNISILKQILNDGDDFGKSDFGKGKKVLVEFVSANPTGPLTLAHGRQAAVGDVLAAILTATGFSVTCEYYLNDRGRQMRLLAQSVYARYCEKIGIESTFPEDGYQGDYIYEVAQAFLEHHGKKKPQEQLLEEIRIFSYKYIMDMIKEDLQDFGVIFDSIFSENAFAQTGKVTDCLTELKATGYVYDADGALWFKSTAFGDDKDRVLIKSDGEMTYITPDIAYHQDKFNRGFQQLINLWGPDHHGYIPRLKAALEALGHDPESLKVLIVQLCTLFQGTKKLSMSTRKGEFVTLREIIDAVGSDAARYFFTARKTDSHLDFDLELAKKKSADNPVYYIQYAHARICRVYEKLNEKGYMKGAFSVEHLPEDFVLTDEEVSLIKLLSRYPDILINAAALSEPSKLTDYLFEVSQLFHQFYNRHRIITKNVQSTEFRVLLVEAVKIVLKNGLGVLRITAPEKM